MKFPGTLKDAFLIIRDHFGLSFAIKRLANLLHFCDCYHYLLVTNYLAIKLLVTYNFSACREYLAENYLSFPSAPRWVWHSYLSKRATIDPLYLWVIIPLWSWAWLSFVSIGFCSWGHGKNHVASNHVNLICVWYFDSMYVVIPLVVSCECRLHDTSPYLGLREFIVELLLDDGLREWQKLKP